MENKETSQLEDMLNKFSVLKKIIGIVQIKKNQDKFKESLMKSVLNYKTKDGKTLEQLSADYGRQEEFQDYVNHVVNDKYMFIYTADNIVSQLEDTLMGSVKGKPGFQNITMKIEGRTLFLPAYLACYVAHKLINESVGLYQGLYDDGLKGRINYSIDMLGLQVNSVGKLAGLGKIIDELHLADMPKRIEYTAVRDIEKWIRTGKPTRSLHQQQVDWIMEKLNIAAEKVSGAVSDYAHNNLYSDHLPSSALQYSPV